MVDKAEMIQKLTNIWKKEVSQLVEKKQYIEARQRLIDIGYAYFLEESKKEINREDGESIYYCFKNTIDGWKDFCCQLSKNPKMDNWFLEYLKRFPIDFHILDSSKKIAAYLYLQRSYEKR